MRPLGWRVQVAVGAPNSSCVPRKRPTPLANRRDRPEERYARIKSATTTIKQTRWQTIAAVVRVGRSQPRVMTPRRRLGRVLGCAAHCSLEPGPGEVLEVSSASHRRVGPPEELCHSPIDRRLINGPGGRVPSPRFPNRERSDVGHRVDGFWVLLFEINVFRVRRGSLKNRWMCVPVCCRREMYASFVW